MAKYLDISGLQRVWNRISSRVIRGDAAQSFTDAYKMQARANISAGASNRNLLDNWYFVGGGSQLGSGRFPINQKELTSYTEAGYNIDRWISTTLTVSADGVTPTGAFYQVQDAAFMSRLLGKTLTASILFADGTLHTGTLTLPTVLPSAATMYTYSGGQSVSGVTAQLYLTAAGTAQILRITTTKEIAAVKLENGAYSTLLNDAPPDYSEELRRCQRYFIRIKGDPIGFGYVSAALTVAYILIPTPVAMYKVPSWSINGSVYVRGTNGTWNSSTITVLVNQPPNGINITVPVSASQVMAVGLYPSSANSYIDFNANI